jgi:hypothetical protein
MMIRASSRTARANFGSRPGRYPRLDPKTGEWKTYRHKAEDSSSLIQDLVLTLFSIARGASGPELKRA